MKKIILCGFFFSVTFVAVHMPLEGFGGRGGGGARGGFGGANTRVTRDRGRTWDASPSMSRAYRPSYGTPVNRRVANYPAARSPAFKGTPSTTQAQVQQFMQRSPAATQGGLQSLGEQRRQGSFPAATQNNIGNYTRANIGRNYPNRSNLFNNDFWKQHPNHYPFQQQGDWWRRASWGTVAGWFNEPLYGSALYWDDGYGYPEEYTIDTQNASSTTQQTAPQQPPQGETAPQQIDNWLPLGVYTLTDDSTDAPPPNAYMQLAVSKTGTLAGNLYVKSYDKTYPLEGKVDFKTQRAVWKMANSENSPFIETGIYNLTKPETPVRVTFADGSVKNKILVRLDKEESPPAQ